MVGQTSRRGRRSRSRNGRAAPALEGRLRAGRAAARPRPARDRGPSGRRPSAGPRCRWRRARASNPRPRLAFAAPLPIGMPAEHELLDAILGARVPMATVREGLAGALPAGLRIVDLFDVWIGRARAPRRPGGRRLPGDRRGPHVRRARRGMSSHPGDPGAAARADQGRGAGDPLRPPAVDPLDLGDRADPPSGNRPRPGDRLPRLGPLLRMRLRHAQDGGIGRPGEVLLALGEVLGRPVDAGTTIRERLWTADELRPV